MAEFGQLIQDVTSGGQSMLWIGVWFLIIVIMLIAIAGLVWFRFYKVRWNLRVEIKLPRSDGRIINGEWGKGFYDERKGAVYIKRQGRGSKKIAMKIFDVKKYLQGSDLLTVIQVSAEDFRPVLNDSYSTHEVEYIDETKPKYDNEGNPLKDEKGNPMYHMTTIKESIMSIKTETGKNKAWRVAFEEASLTAYSIKSLFRQFQAPIAIGIVVICCFIGFAILWTKLSSVCN